MSGYPSTWPSAHHSHREDGAYVSVAKCMAALLLWNCIQTFFWGLTWNLCLPLHNYTSFGTVVLTRFITDPFQISWPPKILSVSLVRFSVASKEAACGWARKDRRLCVEGSRGSSHGCQGLLRIPLRAWKLEEVPRTTLYVDSGWETAVAVTKGRPPCPLLLHKPLYQSHPGWIWWVGGQGGWKNQCLTVSSPMVGVVWAPHFSIKTNRVGNSPNLERARGCANMCSPPQVSEREASPPWRIPGFESLARVWKGFVRHSVIHFLSWASCHVRDQGYRSTGQPHPWVILQLMGQRNRREAQHHLSAGARCCGTRTLHLAWRLEVLQEGGLSWGREGAGQFSGMASLRDSVGGHGCRMACV